MSQKRSKEYSYLVLEIFKTTDEDLAMQLELHSLYNTDPDYLYLGDVTYGEYEFILLKELEFRLTCFESFKAKFHTQVADHLKENV